MVKVWDISDGFLLLIVRKLRRRLTRSRVVVTMRSSQVRCIQLSSSFLFFNCKCRDFLFCAIFLASCFWELSISSTFIVRQSYEGFTAVNTAW